MKEEEEIYLDDEGVFKRNVGDMTG